MSDDLPKSVEAAQDNASDPGIARAPANDKVRHEINDDAMAQLHAAMLGVWDAEADRFWVRNNLMLVVNGVLLGVAVAADQTLLVRLSVCVFGICFSLAWLLMNVKGGYYVDRWRPVIEALEKRMSLRSSFPVLPLLAVRPDSEVLEPSKLRHWKEFIKGTRTPRMDTGEIMHFVIIGFAVAWITLTALYIAPEISKLLSWIAHSISDSLTLWWQCL